MPAAEDRRFVRLTLSIAFLAACLATPASAWAAPSAAEVKIRKALKKKVVVDFEKTPLREATAVLKDYVKVEIQLDVKALRDAGVESDTPITFKVSDVSLKSALNLMLRPLDLTYVYKDEVLLITTPDQVQKYLKVKVYDVRDLLR